MRPSFLALLAGLSGLALVPYPDAPSAASCAGPRLSIEGHGQNSPKWVDLVAGEKVTVTGRWFVTGCDDVGEGSSGLGCAGDEETEVPLEGVELVALQGRSSSDQVTLAVADAGSAADNELGQVTWTFTVPDSLSAGPALLKAEGTEPLRVRIVPRKTID